MRLQNDDFEGERVKDPYRGQQWPFYGPGKALMNIGIGEPSLLNPRDAGITGVLVYGISHGIVALGVLSISAMGLVALLNS